MKTCNCNIILEYLDEPTFPLLFSSPTIITTFFSFNISISAVSARDREDSLTAKYFLGIWFAIYFNTFHYW